MVAQSTPASGLGLASRRWALPQFQASITLTGLSAAVFITLFGNLSLWRSVLDLMPASPTNLGFLLAEFVLITAISQLLLATFSFRHVFKPMLSALLLIIAICAYFMDSYGVILDKAMMQNAMETDLAETSDLIGWRLLGYLVFIWLLPTLLLWRTHIRFGSWRRQLAGALIKAVGAVLLIVLALGSHYKAFSLIGREHKELRMQMNPSYPLYAAVQFGLSHSAAPVVLQDIAEDAHRLLPATGTAMKRVVVLVVGETARSANFSLNGYPRKTNPELSILPIFSFQHVTACGTSTAISVRCMFSSLGQQRFSREQAEAQQNVLDVLSRVGVEVHWRDNNSGCKGVCDRIIRDDLAKAATPELCKDGECYDSILLDRLDQQLQELKTDALIVLHQQGSHGPAYYRRVPSDYKAFQPECQDSNVQNCSRESIVNAYDNTILYTDHLLAQLIHVLARRDHQIASSLIYLSDHGESLGENDIYLHGFPYALAPDEQKQIPFMVWLSTDMSKQLRLDESCLAATTGQPVSHDHLFHSLLGIFDVSTREYKAPLDVFSACRQHGQLASALPSIDDENLHAVRD